MNYKEKILVYLVENYRKSRKDTGINKINRRTQAKPEKFYKKYNLNDGEYEEIAALDSAIEELEKWGFITVSKERFGSQVICIYLVDGKLNEIEDYLIKEYSYVTKDDALSLLQSVVERYEDASEICSKECALLKEKILKRQPPKDIDEIDKVLKAVAFVENNKEKLFVREVSLEVYGDSKYFEDNTLQMTCRLLRKYDNTNSTDKSELIDEILKKYNIYREPQKICIRGKAVICIGDIEVNISNFEEGIEFNASELSKINKVRILVKNFLTIENRTSYLRYKREDTVIFYLGGYANRDQRDFLKLIILCNPEVNYMHFGDIDAGGFWIHHNLCEITGKMFSLFCMSIEELSDIEYAECIHTLSEKDVIRMQELRRYDEYKEVIEYMLKNNVKLEQEKISLQLMRKMKK